MPLLIASLMLLAAAAQALPYEFRNNVGVTGMAVDSAGAVYLTGSEVSFVGPVFSQTSVLIKLDATGAPVYTAHIERDLSGMSGILVSGVAVDDAGSVYITGYVEKSGLPTVSAAQPIYGGKGDAFVAKLKADRSGFVYLTYLGGSGFDVGRRIAVDAGRNAYVTGVTCSTDFPTRNSAQAVYAGKGNVGCDAFVTKLDPTGSTLVYSTYLGGAKDEAGLAIAADSSGNAYVAGSTTSTDFPTASPLQAGPGRCLDAAVVCRDAFVTKLDASGAIVYSTYLGGAGPDQANGIAADAAGNAYVTGSTASADFPTLQAFQSSLGDRGDCGGNCGDAFVVKVDPSGKLVYSTYLGGSGFDNASAIAADAAGNAYVTGVADSSDFPTTSQAPAPARFPAFVAKFSADGSALLFSTYVSPNTDDDRSTGGDAIALDAAGKVYVAGATLDRLVSDAFVVRLDSSGER